VARWIGLDLGAARVGLALSDPDKRLAMPLQTLDRRQLDDQQLAARLAEVASQHQAERLVLGLPVGLSGREGPAAAGVRQIGQLIGGLLEPGCHLSYFDERGSTIQAHQQLHQAGRRGRRQREVVDQVAAVVILQAALDHELVKLSPSDAGAEDQIDGPVGSVR